MSSNIRLNKVCRECGSDFIAKTTVTKYCSHRCANRAYKKRLKNEKIELSIERDRYIIPQHIKYPQFVNKEILSIKEACEFIGISNSTFHRLVKKGKFTTVKLGRRVFVTHKEIRRVFKI